MLNFIYGDFIFGPERYKVIWCNGSDILHSSVTNQVKTHYPDTYDLYKSTNNLKFGDVLFCRASTGIKPVICYCIIDINDYNTVKLCLKEVNKVTAGGEVAICDLDITFFTRIVDDEFFEAIPNIYTKPHTTKVDDC